MDAEEKQQQGRARPESMIARNFSADLDSLFGLNSGTTIGNLNETVQEKKRTVSTQEQELAALEQRLREAEERLARASGSSIVTQKSPDDNIATSEAPSRPQASAGAELHTAAEDTAATNYAPAGLRPSPTVRADSSFHAHIPGAMPRTPTPRYDAREYVTVDRTR